MPFVRSFNARKRFEKIYTYVQGQRSNGMERSEVLARISERGSAPVPKDRRKSGGVAEPCSPSPLPAENRPGPGAADDLVYGLGILNFQVFSAEIEVHSSQTFVKRFDDLVYISTEICRLQRHIEFC